MKESITSKTGNAPIVRQGHTTDRAFGTDPNARMKGRTKPTDIRR